MLGGSLISWKSKKQLSVSRSSCEAEYHNMASCVSELLWVSYLLRDLVVEFQTPILLLCDNKTVIHIASSSVFQLQLADIFTKTLSKPHFWFLTGKLGVVCNPSQLEGM